MSADLQQLVHDWTRWLNAVLANPSLPLYATRSPNDNGADDEASTSKATLHINSLNNGSVSVPTMIGLISTGPYHCDDSEILANDIFHEQIRPLRSAGALFGFVTHGRTELSFFFVEDGSAGRDEFSTKLDTARSPLRSLDVSDPEQARMAKQVLMNDVAANLAQVACADGGVRGQL